jgi:hypothetical protein
MNAHSAAAGAAAALALTLAACAPSVRSDRDETIPVPRGATWTWGAHDSASRFQRDPTLSNEILNQRFHRAIEATMLAKGYRQVTEGGEADFVLTYHMGVARGRPMGRANVAVGVGFGHGGRYRPWGWGPYDRWGWGMYGPPMWGVGYGAAYPVAYREGVLLVLLRLRSSGDVAWQGQYDWDVYDSQRVSQQQVQKLVSRIFESLP